MKALQKLNGDSGGPYGPDRPMIPSERWSWLGLAATLGVCLIAAILYFWFTRARGI